MTIKTERIGRNFRIMTLLFLNVRSSLRGPSSSVKFQLEIFRLLESQSFRG